MTLQTVDLNHITLPAHFLEHEQPSNRDSHIVSFYKGKDTGKLMCNFVVISDGQVTLQNYNVDPGTVISLGPVFQPLSLSVLEVLLHLYVSPEEVQSWLETVTSNSQKEYNLNEV